MAKVPRPPRGFRDFPPDMMILRKQLLSRLERVFQRYGFDPIDTPALEYWETLAGKYGEEAENRLIWRFEDPWSGRQYALRYDLTVPLARFMANHRDLPLPFKRYHIGPVWRHEEPQRGRYREFYQCDADIVGSPYPEADAEIVLVVVDAIKELGFRDGFKVRINDRRLLQGIFEEELGISNPIPVYRVIDKLDKVGLEGVINELRKLNLMENIINKIIDIISLEGEPDYMIKELSKKYGSNTLVNKALEHLEEMFNLLGEKPVVLDLSLVRGLDYYTGPILEAVLDEPRIGSVAGGGRYDNLIGMFMKQDIPATGASIGIERIIDAGLELGIYNLNKKTVTQVQVVVLDRGAYQYAWNIANILRNNDINVRIDVSRQSQKAQRKKASRLNIPILAYVGLREVEEKTVVLYDTRSRERYTVPVSEVAEAVQRIL